ncbi:MAG: hypothetical protein COT81_02750 [Candidatus Buchananbacteria bacterium CG10_big_fil_rev_8_21_14_0_10_42_9]|uniref:Peptidase M16 n=1 Tax=Candidatus Buchananbacteria bacterium CG10_big_fil_rev_8_21_14_0_10_42_9 TaxID=1974526 RepID=A0A2H0W3L1_9BACT|nr:MAG: hypothetical protein COT81_02750 [Candidatus Buchananbacteria bacterium CG10_big_fil_rev_8_21_14_0_10_42_9]
MIDKHILSNHARVVTAPVPGTDSVTVLVYFGVGSRYETKKINGVSHFLEHLFFKGTVRRPTSFDLTKELDSVGAEYNAFTSKDHTAYYVKTSADQVELAFDILSDMLLNSKFDPDEVNRERGVVVEELNMYEDNPMIHIDTVLENCIFGNQPLGWDIGGPRQVIKLVPRQAILDYKDTFYQAQNMVIAVTGKVSVKKARQLAKKYFNLMLSRPVPKAKKVKLHQKTARALLHYKKTEQSTMAVGFPAFDFNDPRLPAVSLLGIILGGNMSSRLFVEVREKHGLAYSVKAGVSGYADTGVFEIIAGVDSKRIKQAIEVILAELQKVKRYGVTAKELTMAKRYFKGQVTLALEDSAKVADWYGKQLILKNKLDTPQARIKKMERVTGPQVRKVSQLIFKQAKLNLAIIGPYKDRKSFERLLKLK